jgi:hypothetical protein
MTHTEKFQFFINSLINQYEGFEDKQNSVAVTIKAVIDYAKSLNEL